MATPHTSPERAKEGELTMPQSLSSVLIHLIFSTKNRQPLITESIETELYKYLGGIFRNSQCPALLVGGDKDHIHALFVLSRTCSLAELVKEVKASSSKWIKGNGDEFQHFQWQAGYGAFSIGQSSVEDLKHYIANQKEHHRRASFEHEFRVLCRKYNIEIDERYVWD
ncbi:MAG: IS200/IS605 family transposase [Acidobacteria bacterium]|nr:IS200/IS605 family transposase [Acidobacteriota bacterium]